VQQPRRLGRGLDSLLEINAENANSIDLEKGIRVVNLPIDKVFANPDQPRKEFDDAALEELASSIREKGVIQPILVLERPGNGYMIIAGERRFRASKLAGKLDIPAIIRSYSIEETMEIALIENLQREDLNPMEEAVAFKSLVDNFGLSQEDIAQKIGKNRSTVANSLRLLKLPQAIQTGISQNKISAGHARTLLAVKASASDQEALYQIILEKGLSVREAEAIAQAINAGISFDEAIKSVKQGTMDLPLGPVDENTLSEPDIFALSQGASIKSHGSAEKSVTERRSPELWDMEEKLILALGTKVQIKGDNKNGKIEIAYFSLDDLERIYDLIAKH